MINSRRLIARIISETYAILRAPLPPKPGLRILMYHAIGTPALGDSRGLFSLEPNLFKQHVAFLSQQKIGRVISLESTKEWKSGLNIAITFDDGYQDNLDIAAPILIEQEIPFTVFVTTKFVQEKTPGFLSNNALRELAALPGVTIGAHGASHIALTQCNPQQLERELTSSKAYLEDILGRPVLSMAYPYGAANQQVRTAISQAGYQLAACSYSDINQKTRDQLLLARTEVLSGDSVRVLRQKLRGDWDWYRWRTPDPVQNTRNIFSL